MAQARGPLLLLPLYISMSEQSRVTRILVCLEDEYRVYRDVLAAGIEALRPCTEVATVRVEKFDEELSRFDPSVVICCEPMSEDRSGRTAWIELSPDPIRPTRMHFDGHEWEQVNPTLEDLLAIIDRVERLAQAQSSRG